ncbi:MAG: DMT family transporter [Clostridia bacterium]|nr:DMT family transporter [Clostridia bacterium]
MEKTSALKKHCDPKALSYTGLFFVVFIWGTAPLVTQHFYKYYSPSIRVFFSEVILFITYMLMSRRHFKEFNREYIKIGIPTGFFLALANVSQKIGLMYTTPARYAFLENLSCITVPILMYFLVGKKPKIYTVLSCFLCLFSVFILNGISQEDISGWGIGEILCAVSGLLYGFNIAGTGAFAKKMYAPMYLAVQSVMGMTVSLIFSLSLNFIKITNSAGELLPIEKIVFSFKPEHIIFTIFYMIISNAVCWTIRTNSMKHIDATAVAIIMPFSAVVTGIISVIMGEDVLNFNLIAGGILGAVAVLVSSIDDIKSNK